MENNFTDVRVQRVKVRHLEKRMLQKNPFKLYSMCSFNCI